MARPEHRPNLIAIDLDGTIEDSRNDMVAAAVRVRRSLGLPARASEVLRPHVNGGMEQLYRACFDDYLQAGDRGAIEIVRRAYEADYLEHVMIETRLYDGMAGALRELAKLGSIACVTNKPEQISRRLLEALGVGDAFATVVGGDSCPEIKPHPIMLQTAAERCGFDRAHGKAFMIGDTNADIQLARAFGAVAVWCAWGYVTSPSEAPDVRARHPSELVEIVVSRLA